MELLFLFIVLFVLFRVGVEVLTWQHVCVRLCRVCRALCAWYVYGGWDIVDGWVWVCLPWNYPSFSFMQV